MREEKTVANQLIPVKELKSRFKLTPESQFRLNQRIKKLLDARDNKDQLDA
jgi:hypothetical protein